MSEGLNVVRRSSGVSERLNVVRRSSGVSERLNEVRGSSGVREGLNEVRRSSGVSEGLNEVRGPHSRTTGLMVYMGGLNMDCRVCYICLLTLHFFTYNSVSVCLWMCCSTVDHRCPE